MHTCTGSHRSRSLSVAAIWGHVGRVLCGLHFLAILSISVLFFLLPSLYPPFFFPLLLQCDGCLHVPLWRLMAGLQELLAMGAFYCLGAGWSQWRLLHTLGTHLDAVVKCMLVQTCIHDLWTWIEHFELSRVYYCFSSCFQIQLAFCVGVWVSNWKWMSISGMTESQHTITKNKKRRCTRRIALYLSFFLLVI